MATGTFKVRSPAAPTATTDAAKRSIIATFRRDSFLNFVYFTDYENRDPQADASASDRAHRSRPTAPTSYRTARAATGCIGDPVRDRRRASTARCTPTTRAC